MAKKLTKDKHWTIEEVTYLKQNYEHKTAKQIAEDLGRSMASVRRKIKNLNIRKPKRKKTNCYKPCTDSTLCWDCDNAYALKCDWITFGKEVWDKAKKRKVEHVGYGHEVELVQVIECSHFVLDKKLRKEKEA